MKLIFCLGNPEEKYSGTRHNVGFFVADVFAKEHKAEFQLKGKFRAQLAEISVHGEKVLIAKPTTYYNLVGESMRSLIDFYKLEPSDILIVHDELALPFGTVRARIGGSDAGSNGIKSINQHGGQDTNRLRVGIASEMRAVMGDVDFVLGRFNADEQKLLASSIAPKAIELIGIFVADQHEPTSHTITHH
jgi:PTH1 family peptidyl-tRNA hydrolase